jgi:peroxiredoxin
MKLRPFLARLVFDSTTLLLDILSAAPPQPGEKAPPFDRMSTRGRLRLLDFIARKPVVLLFPPGDSPDLWVPELVAFQRRIEEFRRFDAVLAAVLPVDETAGRAIAALHGIDYPIVYDPDRTLAKRYGGGNGAWVVDREGMVRFVQRERPAVTAILAALEEM